MAAPVGQFCLPYLNGFSVPMASMVMTFVLHCLAFLIFYFHFCRRHLRKRVKNGIEQDPIYR